MKKKEEKKNEKTKKTRNQNGPCPFRITRSLVDGVRLCISYARIDPVLYDFENTYIVIEKGECSGANYRYDETVSRGAKMKTQKEKKNVKKKKKMKGKCERRRGTVKSKCLNEHVSYSNY